MTRLICLANSWKRGDRCIAGIEPSTGRWIRPVSDLPDGRIPAHLRQMVRREPALLDILEIPLADSGDDFGFASENRALLPGYWQKVGEVHPYDLLPHVIDSGDLLHNEERHVSLAYLQSLPAALRYTLQLVKVAHLSPKLMGQRPSGANKWECTITTAEGRCLTAHLTDPVYTRRLDLEHTPKSPCIVTLSLSMPWQPEDSEDEARCWKLIAGVVELG